MRARFENHRRIASNALLERVAPQRLLDGRIFRASERKNASRGPSGPPVEAPWASSGTRLAANLRFFAPSWSPENASWAALGELLGHSSTLLAPPDPPTADLGSMLDPQGWILVPPGVDLGPSRGRFLTLRWLRELAQTCRIPAKSCRKLACSVGPPTSDSKQGCGGRAKRTQSAAPCVYAGSEAF